MIPIPLRPLKQSGLFCAVFLLIITLNGCSTTSSGHSEFYTWVDETGQMRTVKVDDESSEISGEEAGTPGVTQKNANPDFNPEDFMSSEQVDAKLRDSRLFAWQDESGKQNVAEVDKNEIEKNSEDLGVAVDAHGQANRRFSRDCCDGVSASKIFLWNDLAGRELQLNDYYSYEKPLDSDALILDFAGSDVEDIRIKTFIKRDKLALPDIILLDERFQIKQVLVTPFTHYVEESWASYGYMQGRIDKASLEGVEYLVFLPSQQIGILELGEKQTKITDLGSIMVQRDAPTP